MRGKHLLYNTLVSNSIDELKGTQSKRNEELEARRDCMAARYYYHANICRKRYDDCLLDLNKEFFIQPDTIVKELQLRLEFLQELVSKKTTIVDLRKMYHHFNWAA